MTLAPEQSGTANPNGSDGRLSFRERKAESLRAEKGADAAPAYQPTQPPGESPTDGVPGLEMGDAAGQPYNEGEPPKSEGVLDNDPVNDGYPGEQTPEEDEGAEFAQPEGELMPEEGGDEGGLDPTVQEWRDKAEAAEEARGQMERDYRHKTALIAQKRRALDDNLGDVEAQAQFFANFADQGVQRFEGVNWQELQVNPEEYQRTRAQFQQAVSYQQQMNATLEQVKSRAAEMREEARNADAELSREILPTVIPDWSNDKYRKLCDYAAERFSLPPEVMQDRTEHWIFELLNESMAMREAPGKVVGERRRQTNSAPTGRNQAQPQMRNARGQYQTARDNAFDNPGDKVSFREMQRRKLVAERSLQR